MKSVNQQKQLIEAVTVIVFVKKKTEGGNGKSVREQLQMRCQIRVNYIANLSLDFIKDLETNRRGSRSYMAAILHARANG